MMSSNPVPNTWSRVLSKTGSCAHVGREGVSLACNEGGSHKDLERGLQSQPFATAHELRRIRHLVKLACTLDDGCQQGRVLRVQQLLGQLTPADVKSAFEVCSRLLLQAATSGFSCNLRLQLQSPATSSMYNQLLATAPWVVQGARSHADNEVAGSVILSAPLLAIQHLQRQCEDEP